MIAALLGLLAGALTANATPHFVKGIARERFPTPFGGSPTLNVIAGWAMYVTAALLVIVAHPNRHPTAVGASAAAGALLVGLFHTLIGAFGHTD